MPSRGGRGKDSGQGGRMLRLVTSVRTTIVLLCLLAFLLLLSMLLPQQAVIGDQAFAELVTWDPPLRFLLVSLGLGRMATSPLFLGVLGLFFFQLAVVLVARTRPTWHRIGFRPRPEAGLRAWAEAEPELGASLPDGWAPGHAIEIFRGFGYRPKKVGDGAVWGVKHRTAALGFLLFHWSFFLLFASGILLYYTRFVGTVALTEDQTFTGDYRQVLRRPPSGSIAVPEFTLVSVDPRFDQGEPTHLGAVLRFRDAGVTTQRTASVNHPASWGAARVYVQQAGLAPVFWLQDAEGFTLDRVAASVPRTGESAVIPLDEGRLVINVQAVTRPPPREELSRAELQIVVATESGDQLFDGLLAPGHVIDLGEHGRLEMESLRYWAGIMVISERGGGLLIAGFLVGIAGLVWRLVLHRREVAVVWGEQRLTLVGRSEYFPWRFRDELVEILSALVDRRTAPFPGSGDSSASREGGART